MTMRFVKMLAAAGLVFVLAASWCDQRGALAAVEIAPVQREGVQPGTDLMADIEAWLVASFDLPRARKQPRVEFASPRQIAFQRYRAFTAEKQREVVAALGLDAPASDGRREAVAIYDDSIATIFLPAGWTGRTPAEVSILVHEMVHHLQKEGGLTYPCGAAREMLAYAAQEKWLKEQGIDLFTEFDLDPFTVLATALCM